MLAKLIENELIIAPNHLHYVENGREIFVTNPTAELLKAYGYKEVVESEPIENGVARYEERGDVIVQVWEEVKEIKDMEVL